MDDLRNKVTDRMRRLCSRREYCSNDIYRKVVDAMEGDRNVAEEIVEELVRDKYVDDLRYSSAFARDKSVLSGWGSIKIRHALQQKGICRDVIHAALKEIDAPMAHTRLEKIMETKYRTLKDDPQWKMKMLRFGLGRGYEYDEVSEVIGILSGNSEE